MTISERVFMSLDEFKISQKELSSATGITQSTISNWKAKGTNPTSEKIIPICEFLKVNIAWLLSGEGPMLKTNQSGTDHSAEELLTNLLTLEERLLLDHYRDMSDEKKLEIQKNAAHMAADKKIVNLEKSKQAPVQPQPSKAAAQKEISMRVYDLPASAGFGNYLDDNSETFETLPFDIDLVPPRADFGIRISGNSMEPDIEDGSIVWVKQQIEVDNADIGVFILDGEAFCKKLSIDQNKRMVSLVSLNKEFPPMVIGENSDLRTVGKVLGKSFF